MQFRALTVLILGTLLLAALTAPLSGGDPVRGDLPKPGEPGGPDAESLRPISYRRDIRPILSDRCFKCHGPDGAARRAGLRLDRRDDALSPRDGFPAITPGDPAASALVARIHEIDPDDRMPPADSGRIPLTEEERARLVRWIEGGAPYQDHWAFEAPVRSALPSLADGTRPEHPIDAFVRARLEEVGLAPSPRADRTAQLRRVSLDLSGLPPTVEELDAFLADPSPDAYARVVERLLESDRHAEHLARQWLDAARYADTHGLHLDNERVMWPYRDWVIDAFRKNMPFDRFTIEQLAGDLLPEATLENRIASGFNRCHVTTSEGGAINEEFLVQYAVDRISTTSTIWLGVTAGCAVCHDHKFDPVSQREFYQLYAFFNSTTEQAMDGNAKAPPPVVKVPTAAQQIELARLDAATTDLRSRRDAPDPKTDSEQAAWEESFRTERAGRWQPLDTAAGATLVSENGATIEPKPDGSFLSTGENPDVDTHVLTATLEGMGWKSLRLEALTDPGLPALGPGRAANSNFVLNEVEATVTDATGESHPIDWSGAWADHEQDGWDVGRAIDGNLDALNGWAGEGLNRHERRIALFTAREAFGVEGPWTLTARFIYKSPYGNHHLGRTRYALARTEEPALAERAWIDDDEDLGAERKNDGKVTDWTFVRAPEAPVHSGELARRQSSDGLVQHYFHQAKHTVTLGPGDRLYAWVHLDPENPPQTVMLQFHDEKSWDHRAFWGEDRVVFGDLGRDAANHRPMGELPAIGEWVRLEVPFAKVGLRSGSVLSGFAFTQFGGTAFWDDAGVIGPDPVLTLESIVATPSEHREAPQADLLRQRFRLEHSPRHAQLLAELAESERAKKMLEGEIPTTLISQEIDPPRPAHLLERGQYDLPKEQVERDTPAFLPPFPEDAPRDRLGFARWLVSPENPLTARVTVNRIWQSMFGTGLVRTSEDFGSQGEWPSHPELLDWLAVEFRESGWDRRHLLRLMVLSETYRQDSRVRPDLLARDPENRLLARGVRHRLDAEVIRDQALYVSGVLVETVGGPPVKPYQPEGVWEAVGYTDSNTRNFMRDDGDALHRRSLYTFIKRTAPPPSMQIFDAPNRETCTVRRERTNTPLAALVLLNDVQYVEAARRFGRRILLEGGASDDERLTWGFRSVTARAPSDEEKAELLAALEELRATYAAAPDAAGALLEVGEIPRDPSLDTAEHAAWTVFGSLLLNLDEAITKG